MSRKKKFIAALEGKEYGGIIYTFDYDQLAGSLLVDNKGLISVLRINFPRSIVKILEKDIIVTDRKYFDIMNDTIKWA